MRIIKQGNIDNWTKQVECWRCHSTLEIERNDVFTGQGNFPTVECPVCKAYIDVPK